MNGSRLGDESNHGALATVDFRFVICTRNPQQLSMQQNPRLPGTDPKRRAKLFTLDTFGLIWPLINRESKPLL